MSYNSYVITDQKIAVMDTVDARATDAWLENLDFALMAAPPTIWSSPTWSRTTPPTSPACPPATRR